MALGDPLLQGMAAKLEDFDIDTMAMHQGTQGTMYTVFSFSILPFYLFEINNILW